MTTPSDHDVYAELAAGYALHALEPFEETALAAHLEACSTCRQELAVHRDTLGHLAYATQTYDLPVGILAGIRAEIGAGSAAPAATTGATVSAAPDTSMDPAASTGLSDAPAPISLDAARRWRRPTPGAPGMVALAAAVALVLSLGIWNISLHRAKSQEDVRASRLEAAVATLEHGAKQRVELTNQLGRPVAVAVVRADNTVSLVVDGLAPNDRSNSTYVLWQKGAYGVVRAVGVFDVKPGVNVVPNLPLARDVVGVQEFAVTQESGRRAPAASARPPVADGIAT